MPLFRLKPLLQLMHWSLSVHSSLITPLSQVHAGTKTLFHKICVKNYRCRIVRPNMSQLDSWYSRKRYNRRVRSNLGFLRRKYVGCILRDQRKNFPKVCRLHSARSERVFFKNCHRYDVVLRDQKEFSLEMSGVESVCRMHSARSQKDSFCRKKKSIFIIPGNTFA